MLYYILFHKLYNNGELIPEGSLDYCFHTYSDWYLIWKCGKVSIIKNF
jgi:hypothetical protein